MPSEMAVDTYSTTITRVVTKSRMTRSRKLVPRDCLDGKWCTTADCRCTGPKVGAVESALT